MSSTISKNSPPTSESEPGDGDEGDWNNPGYGHSDTSDSDSDDQANDAPMMALTGHGLPQFQAVSMQGMMLPPSMAGMHIAQTHSNLHPHHQPQQQQHHQYPIHHQAVIYGAAAHMAGTEASSSASTPPLVPSRSHGNRRLHGGSDPNLPMLNPGSHHAPRLAGRPPGLAYGDVAEDSHENSSGYYSSESDTSFLKTPPESGDEEGEEGEEEEADDVANEPADGEANGAGGQAEAGVHVHETHSSNSASQSRRQSIGARHTMQNQSASSLSTATGYTADSAGGDNEGGPPSSGRSTVSSRRRTGVYIQPHVDTSSVSRYGEGYHHMDIDKNEDGSLEVAEPTPSAASHQHPSDLLIPALISVSRRKRDVQIFQHFNPVDKPDGMIGWEEHDSGASTKAKSGQGSGTATHSRNNSVLQGPAEASFMATVRSRLEQTKAAQQDIAEGVLDLAANAMNDSLSASKTEMRIRCPRCPPTASTVTLSEWDTHGDWHVARDLQARELRNEDVSEEFRRAFNMDSESGSEKPPLKRTKRSAESAASTAGRRQQSLLEAWK
ncbi:hypothetical protein EC988_002440 [Linderina pennispora]|nr:hypothetical protein EC988_002440 [Linderina pennispora]